MKRFMIAVCLLMLASCAEKPVSVVTPPGDAATGKGEVLGFFWDSPDRAYVPFSNDGTGKNAVIATEKYVDGKVQPSSPFTGNLNGHLVVYNTAAAPKGSFAKYISGTGHKDATTTLGAESQYVSIGGKEYGLNSYRGIGLGYSSDINTGIKPAFIGYQETNIDNSTYGDVILATRSNNQNIAPSVRFRVTSQGDVQTYTGYTPKTDISVATKAYVDAAVKAAVAQAISSQKN